VVREPEARAQTELHDWERDGGTTAPRVQTEG